jgi:hypothetical protein
MAGKDELQDANRRKRGNTGGVAFGTVFFISFVLHRRECTQDLIRMVGLFPFDGMVGLSWRACGDHRACMSVSITLLKAVYHVPRSL